MKKILMNITSIVLVTMLVSSCSDLLEEENIRVPVADVYYKTAEGYEDLINSCYPPVRVLYGDWRNLFQMNVIGTDLWLNGGDGPKELGYYTANPDEGTCWDIWQKLYTGIATCNTAIDRASGVPDSEIAEADLNLMIGEAYFLRAFYYHHLVIHWGGVPLELKEITEVKTTGERATEQQVYDQIIADLLKAEELLLNPEDQADFGRANKGAAQALLARVYLWNKQYANAAEYAKKVIDEHSYTLLDDFGDLWDINNEENAEVIFAAPYTSDPQLGAPTYIQHFFLARYDLEKGMIRDIANGRPFRHYMPSRKLMDLFGANRSNDSRFDKSFTSIWYANNANTLLPEMVLGDTALRIEPYAVSQAEKDRVTNKYTLYDINYYYDETSPNGWLPKGPRHTFPSLNKFDDPTRPSVNSTHGTHDIVIFRLAEMYMIAAEALMMDGKAAEGVEYFNAVRRRAAWDGMEAAMEISAAELTIEAILDERALEFAGECVGRWTDLKRTGKLLEYVKLYNPDAAPNIQDFHVLRPIPQNMLDRLTNKEEFKQNTGY